MQRRHFGTYIRQASAIHSRIPHGSPTGRRARYYTITAAGRRKLGEKVSAFDRVLAAIDGVMKGA